MPILVTTVSSAILKPLRNSYIFFAASRWKIFLFTLDCRIKYLPADFRVAHAVNISNISEHLTIRWKIDHHTRNYAPNSFRTVCSFFYVQQNQLYNYTFITKQYQVLPLLKLKLKKLYLNWVTLMSPTKDSLQKCNEQTKNSPSGMSDPTTTFSTRTYVCHTRVFACSLAPKLLVRFYQSFYQNIFTRLNIFSGLKSIGRRIKIDSLVWKNIITRKRACT